MIRTAERIVYPVRIRWLNGGSEYDVLIADYEWDGEETAHDVLVNGTISDTLSDDDIFFYGMNESEILDALEGGKPCENEWIVVDKYES